ncbi:ParB/RepB/Spo0J family partition protein [Francisellaceae bacterium]|nr:ParB/RepB/Spo0J family partition protein [Francisellaceae bacterium]
MAVSIKKHDNKESIAKVKSSVQNMLNDDALKIVNIPVEEIQVDQSQPRKSFNNIHDLANSITAVGLIQPIIVKRIEHGYMIIAGERRFRAFLHLNKSTIPAIIKSDINQMKVEFIQLLENDDRESLNPLEEADAIQNLLDKYSCSIRDLATKLGKSKDWIQLRSSLSKSPDEIRSIANEGLCQDIKSLALLRNLYENDQEGYQKCYSKLITGQLNNIRKYIQDYKSRGKYTQNIKPKEVKSIIKSDDKLILKLANNTDVEYILASNCIIDSLIDGGNND